MLELNVQDETSLLKTVILGTAQSNGVAPKLEDCYDPKSRQAVSANQYPLEVDMQQEIQGVKQVLERYGVQVLQPEVIEDCNQIFARDLGFVIDDTFFKANMIYQRTLESQGLETILQQINPENIIFLPEDRHIEGGDVILWGDYIFVGSYYGQDYQHYITARTNLLAIDYLKARFPHKQVKSFNLLKSNTAPENNALHLDCVFQPVGRNKAIIYKPGFLISEEAEFLINLFGQENVFEITRSEMVQLYTNVFSISPEIIISVKNFVRLNQWLRSHGFVVEEVEYSEIPKQGGLLRCSTLPLSRVSIKK